ncbi:MAG: PIG-L deacetylase family protein [Planctomycetia bacterium]
MAKQRVLVIGAHPDDCDIKAGGTAALWTAAGVEVVFVSMTDGRCGHQSEEPAALADRRRAEAAAAGGVLGISYHVLSHPDGGLEPTVANRLETVRLIRRAKPDLVLTHRPNDYHPDHRYTAQLVQDAAYMVTVPHCAPDVPFLHANPIFGSLSDTFSRPCPFSADMIVPIDSVVDQVTAMLDKHASQFYEWMPFNRGFLNEVPTGAAERLAWVKKWYLKDFALRADAHRRRLVAALGPSGEDVQVVEAFEISEYGSPLTAERKAALFPFLHV